MTNLPPDNAGWVSGLDGVPQRGTPPPGWWQASDLRWYPPTNAAPAAPPPAPAAPPPAPAAPAAGPAAAPATRSRTGCVLVGLLVLIVVVVGGCGAVLLAGGGLFAVGSSSSEVVTPAVPATAPGEVQSCTHLDDRTYQIDLVSRATVTTTYALTIGFVGFDGATVGSASATAYALEPGERLVEPGPATTSAPWAGCRVTIASRTEVPADRPGLADVACAITGADGQGRVKGTATATNSTDQPVRYNVVVAYRDGSGVRRGTALARVPVVQPGRSGSDALVSQAANRPGLTCTVVDVQRVPG